MQCSECVNPVSLGRIAASLLALLRMLRSGHTQIPAHAYAVWPGWAYVVWQGGMFMLHAVAYDTWTERRIALLTFCGTLLGTRAQSTHWTAWSSSVPMTPECATAALVVASCIVARCNLRNRVACCAPHIPSLHVASLRVACCVLQNVRCL